MHKYKKFSNYRSSDLPEYLNPLKLRHYLLLAYWIYFRPTALRCYLYKADPELYCATFSISRILSVRAYRNLYLLLPGASALLSVIVGLPILLATSWGKGTPPDLLGATLGAASGLVLGLLLGLALGSARGVWSSTSYSLVRSAASAVVLGVVLALARGLSNSLPVALASGLAPGVALFLANGVILGLGSGAVFFLVSGLVLGLASSWKLGLAFVIGALRIPFYLFELGWMLLGSSSRRRYAFDWDELVVLPLPGTQQLLTQFWQRDERYGLHVLSDLVCNPFQRWAAQRMLQAYLHNRGAPLHFLYDLLTDPYLDAYVFAPVTDQDWRQLPTTRQVLLGELDGHWANCATKPFGIMSEYLVWYVTQFMRDRRKTPLTTFAGMLYELLDEETVKAKDFNLSSYQSVYSGLTYYPGGLEIKCSFEMMASFLSYNKLSDLPKAVDIWPLNANAAIRPSVLAALNRLRDIATEVATSFAATSRVNKLAAFARATAALDDLDESLIDEAVPPEQTILRRIIGQWRPLVSEEGGRIGGAVLSKPIANPYTAGNPVTGHLFVGREDIMRRFQELWVYSDRPPSVVLYGHRRMGKSSILRNLGTQLGTNAVIVDFNMQRVGLVDNTGQLLYSLALTLYNSLPAALQEQLQEPDWEPFVGRNSYIALENFLRQLDRIRSEEKFIVAIDEFELIEQLIEQNRLEPELLQFWRGLIQTYSWFIMAFAGLHSLQEMTWDFWEPFFASVTTIPVSFLSPRAARQLIVQPSPDFPIDYDPEAVERIIQLTNGQPYLVQLIGYTLVTLFNRQNFEEGIEGESRFTVADVEAAIETRDFCGGSNAYFNGVWAQAEHSQPPKQTTILEELVPGGLSLTQIADRTGLSYKEVEAALETLQRHDAIEQHHGQYIYTVELMRRWVAQRIEAQ